MTDRQEYVARLKAKLDEWNARIDELEVQAKLAEMENRERYEAEIARFKEKRDELRSKLEAMRESGPKAFDELRQGAEQAWESLREAYKRAREHLD